MENSSQNSLRKSDFTYIDLNVNLAGFTKSNAEILLYNRHMSFH